MNDDVKTISMHEYSSTLASDSNLILIPIPNLPLEVANLMILRFGIRIKFESEANADEYSCMLIVDVVIHD